MSTADVWVGFILGAGAGAVFAVGIILITPAEVRPGYMQGQVDALNGEVRVELVERDDGSRVWQRTDSPREMPEVER